MRLNSNPVMRKVEIIVMAYVFGSLATWLPPLVYLVLTAPR